MLLLAAWDVVMLQAAAVAAAAAATFDVLMPRAAADVSGQLTTARAANSYSLSAHKAATSSSLLTKCMR